MGDPIRELIHFETDAINPQLPSKSCHLAYSPHWANKVKASELTCQQPRFSTDPDWAVFLNIIRQRPPTTQDEPEGMASGTCPAASTWPRCLARSVLSAHTGRTSVQTNQCHQESRAGQVGG